MNQIQEQHSDIIRSFYEALNSFDVPAAMKLCDPMITRIEWEGLPSEGVFHGLAELEKHIIAGRSTWAEGGCRPENFTSSGDKIIVSVHVLVRLNESTEWIDGYTADGFSFSNNKILEFRTFLTKDDALAWAAR